MSTFVLVLWFALIIGTIVFAFRRDRRNMRLCAGASVLVSILAVVMMRT